ncbi:MAG: NAD(+)/NADH kinase [Myxococcales bacterium]|nr:NAD(+)/NADH kinase [Myxococcales bacterium]MCB9650147.1 NAD(+)/NADH kinase [Deltaproteobacteria bacterium]
MTTRALVVMKRTALSRLKQSPDAGSRRMLELMAEADESVAGIRAAHMEHVASVDRVRETLRRLEVDFKETHDLPKRPIKDVDLVIAVGGDGTALAVSHAVRDGAALLAVNSAPSFSVGHLTGATAETFEERLLEFMKGKLRPLTVQRLNVRIGRRALPEPVLNDVLFCADNPALMTRYKLTWPDGEELQRSSGVWVSTPAGSTGALASAGGPILPLTARQFAFYVREPYSPPGETLRVRSAVLVKEDVLHIECRIHGASVFIDGSHRVHEVPFGETVSFTLDDRPLYLVRPPHLG